MAIRIVDEFPGKTAGVVEGYPHGKARDVSAPNDGNGTPLAASLVNDDQGFKQALLESAGITPNGVPDEVGASQYLDALKMLFTGGILALGTGDDGIDIPVVTSSGVKKVISVRWGTFTTAAQNLIPRPQMVSIAPVAGKILYANVSPDGGNSAGGETATMDWSLTTRAALAVYSNYVGVCKYFAVGV